MDFLKTKVMLTMNKLLTAMVIAFFFTLPASARDFEPKYIGGYPTEETAERMFEEYDYQSCCAVLRLGLCLSQ